MTVEMTTDQMFAYMEAELNQKPTEPTYIDVELCTNCDSYGNITNNVCRNCGFSSNNYIYDGAEWTGGISEDGVASDPSRVGMASNPLYSANWGKATLMNVKRDQYGKYGLASRINMHAGMNHRDRALHKAYDDFENAGLIKMGLSSSILVKAKMYYKSITETSLTRGAIRKGVKANCLFWACKHAGVPRSTQEIATAFNIDTKDISRTSDKVRDIIKPPDNKITLPADMVTRIFTALTVSMSHEDRKNKMKCIKKCNELKECSKLMGKTPIAVAATVVMNELNLTKQVISKAAGVSVATIAKIDIIIKDWNNN